MSTRRRPIAGDLLQAAWCERQKNMEKSKPESPKDPDIPSTSTSSSISNPPPSGPSPTARRLRDRIVLAVGIILTLLSISQLPRIRIDSSTDVFIPRNHAIQQINAEIEREFSSISPMIMGIEVRFGSVFDPEVIDLVDRITRELEAHPAVDRVVSLTNLDYIRGSEFGLEVVPVLADTSPQGLEDFRKRIADWKDVYVGTCISRDETFTVIIVQPDAGGGDERSEEIYRVMEQTVQANVSPDLNFVLAGLPIIKSEINRSVLSDIFWLIPIAALIILAILWGAFRRWEGVVFPLLCLLMAMLWCLGLIGLLGITFTMATLLVPVLLLVVGSAYGIHLLSHFFHEVTQQKGFLDISAVDWIIQRNQRQIVRPILLAGMTTAGGFLALLSSPLGPFRMFGLLSAVGIGFSLLASLVGIPVFLRMRYRKGIDSDQFHLTDRKGARRTTLPVFSLFEQIIARKKWLVISVSLGVLAAAVLLVPQVTVGTDMIKFFHKDSPIAADTEVFNTHRIGSNTVSILIEAPAKGDILDPGFLADVEKFADYLTSRTDSVMNIQSIVPHIKRINQLMHVEADINVGADADAGADIDVGADIDAGAEIDAGADAGLGFADIFSGFDSVSDPGQDIDTDLGSGTESVSGTESSSSTLNKQSDYSKGTSDPDDTSDPASFASSSGAADSAAALLREGYLQAGLNPAIEEVIAAVLRIRNTAGTAYYEIPQDPEKYGLENADELKNLLAQYLVIYSGNLGDLINDSLEPDKTVITLQVGNDSYAEQAQLQHMISDFWDYHIPEGWSYSVGGGSTLAYVLSALVTRSQYVSLIGALIIVWILISLMFKSPSAGLLAMVPVLFALAGIFICMVLFNFQLDIITSLLASLAIGIGADYGIHLLDAYRRHRHEGKDIVVHRVFQSTGKAIYINAVSVALGFMGLVISRFTPIKQMGILFAVAMLSAGLASLIVLPLILQKWDPEAVKKRS